MIAINFFGGPGSGKSTLATEFFTHMRTMRGPNVELVGEFATDLCFEQAKENLKDQVYLAGNQWHRLWRLSQLNVEVAVSDSPIMLGYAYCQLQETPYTEELKALKLKLMEQHRNYNILVERDIYSEGGFKGNKKKKNNKYLHTIDSYIRKIPVEFDQRVVFANGLGNKIFQDFMFSPIGRELLDKYQKG